VRLTRIAALSLVDLPVPYPLASTPPGTSLKARHFSCLSPEQRNKRTAAQVQAFSVPRFFMLINQWYEGSLRHPELVAALR
jgi:hypothetical protein